MDYKRLIKSRKIRSSILQFFSFIPDKTMLQIQYRIKFGRKLDLKNPKRFTEKLQWYKLYYRTPLMKQCVDKYDVRDYVKSCGFENILIPLIGIYDSVSDVDFDKLPERCVIKDTLGGGGNSVILCSNKKIINRERIQAQMTEWVEADTSYKIGGREWPYGGKKHRIIIEDLLPSDEENGGLIDYKFFCFDGVPKIIYVIADRKVGQKAGFGIFTPEYKKLDVVRVDEEPLERDVPKPEQWDEMLSLASKLSEPFPEARIDLYCVDGKIYFGEITFFDGSGYMSFDPDEFDYQMGEYFNLPNR